MQGPSPHVIRRHEQPLGRSSYQARPEPRILYQRVFATGLVCAVCKVSNYG